MKLGVLLDLLYDPMADDLTKTKATWFCKLEFDWIFRNIDKDTLNSFLKDLTYSIKPLSDHNLEDALLELVRLCDNYRLKGQRKPSTTGDMVHAFRSTVIGEWVQLDGHDYSVSGYNGYGTQEDKIIQNLLKAPRKYKILPEVKLKDWFVVPRNLLDKVRAQVNQPEMLSKLIGYLGLEWPGKVLVLVVYFPVDVLRNWKAPTSFDGVWYNAFMPCWGLSEYGRTWNLDSRRRNDFDCHCPGGHELVIMLKEDVNELEFDELGECNNLRMPVNCDDIMHEVTKRYAQAAFHTWAP